MGIALTRGGCVAWTVGWGACPSPGCWPSLLAHCPGQHLVPHPPERAGHTLMSSVWLQRVGGGGPSTVQKGQESQGWAARQASDPFSPSASRVGTPRAPKLCLQGGPCSGLWSEAAVLLLVCVCLALGPLVDPRLLPWRRASVERVHPLPPPTAQEQHQL